MTGPQGMGPLQGMSRVPLTDAFLQLSPLSYWTLRGNDAGTLHDYGTLANDLTNTGVTLNTTPGDDGYSYPNPGATHAYLTAADNAAYTIATSGGLTFVFFLYITSLSTGSRILSKLNNLSTDEYAIQCTVATQTLTAASIGASGASRQITQAPCLRYGWNLVTVRYTSTSPHVPDIRNNMLNLGGTLSGVLASNGDSIHPIRLFSYGSTTNHMEQAALAHVAVYAGYKTDLQILGIEAAAVGEGWNLATAECLGGTITEDANYRYHEYLSTPTALVMKVPGLVECEVIAAGGGSASNNGGNGPGGGGAGGRTRGGKIVGVDQYIVQGAGGVVTPSTGTFAVAAADTTVGTLFSAAGGGGGGSRSSWRGGGTGGSGGGGGDSNGSGGLGTQGNNGGNGGVGNVTTCGGGGGGVGGAGSPGAGTAGGAGGAGSLDLLGNTVCQGGGGRGSVTQPTQTAQTANTGNGGNATSGVGQVGQTGKVIVRYPIPTAGTPPTPAFVAMGTLFSAAGSLTNTVALPSFVAGDFALLVAQVESLNNFTTVPSGWNTEMTLQNNNSNNCFKIYSRFLQAGDANPVVTHSPGAQRVTARIYVFRNVKSALVIQDSQGTFTNGNDTFGGGFPVAGSKLATADVTTTNAMIFQVHVTSDATGYPIQAVGSGTSQLGTGLTELHLDNLGSGAGMAAAWRAANKATAYTPINYVLSGTPTPYPFRWSAQFTLEGV